MHSQAIDGREDVSPFIVHLTRDSDEGNKAEDNLLRILKEKTIFALNSHWLFMHIFDDLEFSKLLRKQFRSVCFTEAPLSQIRYLTRNIRGRRVKLQPYGLVFRKEYLLKKGGSPAIYVSAYEGELKDYLIRSFKKQFRSISKYKTLRRSEGKFSREILRFYASINIISTKYDFSWEREWRYVGDFNFSYKDIVAVIACNPHKVSRKVDKLSRTISKQVPIIDPNWSYEQIIDSLL